MSVSDATLVETYLEAASIENAASDNTLAAYRADLDLYLRRYELALDEVPDPYYGGEDGFEQVLDLIEQASDALLVEIKGRL